MKELLLSTRRRLPRWLLFTVLFWVIITFIYTPVISLFQKIFFDSGTFSFEVIRVLTASKRVMQGLTNSFIMAVLTIILVNIVGIFQVAVTEFFDIKFAKILRLAFFTPLLYSSVALVSGYQFLYGSGGALTEILTGLFPAINPGWFRGGIAILFVHTFSMTVFHIIFVRNAAKRNVDNNTIEAARTLGANTPQIFLKVALPILRPPIYAATVMVFLMALGSHAAPIILGGREFQMINSLVQNLNSIGRTDMAALLALILGLASFGLLTVFRSIEKRGHYLSLNTAPPTFRKIKIQNPLVNGLVHGVAYILGIIYLMPVIFIVLFSFTPSAIIMTEVFPSQFTLSNYIDVLSDPVLRRPLLMSILLASLSSVASIIISLVSITLMRKSGPKLSYFLEFSMFIPWILPASMLAIGLISAFSTPNILLANKVLLGSFLILPVGYSVTRLPFAVRMLTAAFRGIHGNLENAAQALGAKPFYIYFKVIIPLLMPSMLSIWALTFNGLLAEYTLSALLFNINNKPLGIAIRQGAFSIEPEHIARTLIYVVIVMFISLITILATNYLNERRAVIVGKEGGKHVFNDPMV